MAPVFAQLPNEVFYDSDSIIVADTNRFSLSWRSMGFTKNNEYFNRIADGYTLFGTQLNPKVYYTVSPVFRVEAGFYLRDDFGNSGIEEFLPTITLRAKYLGIEVLFGAIDGALNHRLIEPFYDFERVMMNRIENGVQFKLDKEDIFADVWVEWETMIYPGDSLQEEVIGGVVVQKELNDHWSLPFQMIVYHKGGQIDRSPAKLQTTGNFTAGIIRKDTFKGMLKSLETSIYYAVHKDFSQTGLMDYTFGKGLYVNSLADFGHGLHLMLSYWKGNQFTSIMGGKLYPSVSSSYKYAQYREPNRELLIVRLIHDVHLGKGVVLSTRIEPHYDFNRKKVEFSNALYLQFNQLFRKSK